MNGFVAEVDPNAQAAREEALSGGNGIYPPLPKGRYQAVIVALAPAKNLPCELTTFGGAGANKDKPVLRLAAKIVDGSPTGKGRVIFFRVPMFSRYAPTEKNPQGATARTYFDFWEKVVGLPAEVVLSGQLGVGPEAFLGKPLTIVVSDPKEPRNEKDAENNPLGSNEVDFVDAPGDIALTPLRKPGVPVAAWLDANDNLKPDYTFAYQKTAPAAAYGAPAAPTGGGWGAPAAAAPTQTAPLTTGATPGWGTPPAQPAAQPAAAATPGWGAPPSQGLAAAGAEAGY
ncbi:hypothetical protein MRBLMI12_000483 [Microbacterium sp. LMI12-1-1.1]|uniref:hypothetical protein n=1 Tax=Microbacterium sp. LMI12-1-1.1 TaxID=3135225 RepID=UPI00342851A1